MKIEGLEQATQYFNGLVGRLASGEFWGAELGDMMEAGERYAASISPVVTGSYRDAHIVTVADKVVTMSIDPAARNGNVAVSRYAGSVEEKYHVHARTAEYVGGLIEKLEEKLINGD